VKTDIRDCKPDSKAQNEAITAAQKRTYTQLTMISTPTKIVY